MLHSNTQNIKKDKPKIRNNYYSLKDYREYLIHFK